MTPPEDCRCHVCGRCYHDHGGLAHRWVTPYPCPSSTLDVVLNKRLWCTQQQDHAGQCVYGEGT